jgi:hypothetical protein
LKSLEKIQIFEKEGKNLDKTAEEKLVFFTFSERGKVRHPQKYEKKVKITAP